MYTKNIGKSMIWKNQSRLDLGITKMNLIFKHDFSFNWHNV